MAIDTGALAELVRDLGAIPAKVAGKVPKVVSKGAVNVKNQLRKEAAQSGSFKQLARTIDYEIKSEGFGGDTATFADVGPNKDNGGAASLAGIAYFGSSRPGGGTLPDPRGALDAEESKFVNALEDLTKGLL